MSISIDLLLFEPRRDVLYGMPVFIGTDAKLLRSLLRGHGEWWDNPSMWLAGYFDEPARIELRGMFNTPNGKRHAGKLIPHLDADWKVEPAAGEAEIMYAEGAAGSVSVPLAQAWFVHRDAMPWRITAAQPGPLARQRGYWSPCDGAVALDLSGLDTASSAQIATFVEQLMAQPKLIDALRARAECCFLFHVACRSSPAGQPSTWLDIRWGREKSLPGRHGYLIEAELLLDTGIAPTEASRS